MLALGLLLALLNTVSGKCLKKVLMNQHESVFLLFLRCSAWWRMLVLSQWGESDDDDDDDDNDIDATGCCWRL